MVKRMFCFPATPFGTMDDTMKQMEQARGEKAATTSPNGGIDFDVLKGKIKGNGSLSTTRISLFTRRNGPARSWKQRN